MDTPTLDAQIGALKDLRLDAASRSRDLAERELGGRLLRLEAEQAALQGSLSKSEAEKRARVDPRYLEHERETIRLTFERERVLAEAESTLLNVKLQMLVLERTTV